MRPDPEYASNREVRRLAPLRSHSCRTTDEGRGMRPFDFPSAGCQAGDRGSDASSLIGRGADHRPSSLRQHRYNRAAERGQVTGMTGRDEGPIDDAFLVDPCRARVDAIVFHAGVRCHPTTLHDPGTNRHPGRVADRGDDFGVPVHRADEVEDFFVTPESVGSRDAAWDDYGIEL